MKTKKVTFEVRDYDHPEAVAISGENHDDWHQLVYECHDGVPVRELGHDSMEPEDARFCRDLDWVVRELNAAYERGAKDAMGSQRDDD